RLTLDSPVMGLNPEQVAITARDTEQMSDQRQRILTGVRPTGPLDLGHYLGALENWVRLQDTYECFFLLADYQVADYADRPDVIRTAIMEIALACLPLGP